MLAKPTPNRCPCSTLRRTAGRGEYLLEFDDEPLGGDGPFHQVQQRHSSVYVDHRRDLITLPSVVESNWKSIAHNTFGAIASTTGPEDTPAAHENCGTASKFIDRCLTSSTKAKRPSAFSKPTKECSRRTGCRQEPG